MSHINFHLVSSKSNAVHSELTQRLCLLLVGNTRYSLYVLMYLTFNGERFRSCLYDMNLYFPQYFSMKKFQQRKVELHSKEPCSPPRFCNCEYFAITYFIINPSLYLSIHQWILCVMYFKVRCRCQYTSLLNTSAHIWLDRVQYFVVVNPCRGYFFIDF